jgi:hypothetical protein
MKRHFKPRNPNYPQPELRTLKTRQFTAIYEKFLLLGSASQVRKANVELFKKTTKSNSDAKLISYI